MILFPKAKLRKKHTETFRNFNPENYRTVTIGVSAMTDKCIKCTYIPTILAPKREITIKIQT